MKIPTKTEPLAKAEGHFGEWAPHAIALAGVFIAIVMVSLCAFVLYQSRLDAMDRARDTSTNLALMAERDVERNFELYDLSLQAIVEGARRPEVMTLPPRLQRDVLFDRAATARYLGAMLLLDAAGNVVVDSDSDAPPRGNLADRKYFIVQRDHPGAGLYISDPHASRSRPGSMSIVLSRRISRPDGSFAGIAMISVKLDYFRDLFAGLSLGTGGAISLIGRDGVMVMRQPYDPRTPGRDISSASTFRQFLTSAQGSFIDQSTIDGTRRLYYFRNFPKLPLIIMVASAEHDIYANWKRRAIMVGSLMSAAACGLVLLSFVLANQLRRRMRAESEMIMLARTDGLTGLNNRRTLGEILDQEWRRARRTRSAFSLLFVDIDRFKAYNDRYGHLAGDQALTAVARCIESSIRRPLDNAARYGGEEFIVVLPDTSQAGASHIAEKIRSAISELQIEHSSSEFGRLTASIGMTTWIPDLDSAVTDLIRAADDALYSAKAKGRNCVAAAC